MHKPVVLFALASLATLSTAVSSTTVSAQKTDTVPAPAFRVGDTWLYDETTEKGQAGFDELRWTLAVQEIGSDTMTVGTKRDGAPTRAVAHLVGTDWSQRRLVDGRQTVTTRPFQFPLNPGRSWTVDYVDGNRRGNQLSNHVRRTYTVLGWEDVVVPAGHFHALEVEEKGVDELTVDVPGTAGSAASSTSGAATAISHVERGGISKVVRVTHAEIYYAPAVRNFVKTVEEQYNADNVRVWQQTQSLITFTPAT